MKSDLKIGKIIILILCVALMAISATAVTMAFLTDTSEDVNTFVMGNVSMSLDEAKVNANGEPIGTERTTEGNQYHLVPGGTYTKDPTVTVRKGTEGAYIRLLVTVKYGQKVADVYERVENKAFLPEYLVNGWQSDIWQYEGYSVGADENEIPIVVYEFRYHEVVSASFEDVKLEPLFTEIKVPGEFSIADVKELAGVEVSVVGNGIQSAGFENADEAWAAFEEQTK